MKRIFFDRNGRVKNPFFPFWQPWGCLGCLWRVLVFLALMLLLAWLLSLLKGCDNTEDVPEDLSEIIDPVTPADPVNPDPDTPKFRSDSIIEQLRDTSKVDDWFRQIPDSVPGAEHLPDPIDNYIPPVDSSRVIPNPIDSIGEIIADQLMVFFNSKDSSELESDMTSFATQFKEAYPGAEYEIAYYNLNAGTMILQVPENQLVQLLDEIPAKVTGLDYRLAPVSIMQEAMIPSDPGFSERQYRSYYENIQAFNGWDITTGTPDVKVAIVDSFFFLNHPELNGRWVEPIHIPTKTRDVYPRNGVDMGVALHGSHVAGIAVGAMNNGGASGIAPDCRWIPVSLGDQMTDFCIIEGIMYAIYKGADVVNLSIGEYFGEDMQMMPVDDQISIAKNYRKRGEELWEYVYKVANDKKCVIVTAAGNETLLAGLDPSKRNENTIRVSAVDNNNDRADFSNFGLIPEKEANYSTVSAPGVAILSSVLEDKYVEMPGTSMSSPFVAGTVALMKSIDKSISAKDVIDILVRTGKPLAPEYNIGPLIQIHDALNEVKERLLNYDEVLKDPTKLIGRWEATEHINLVEVGTGRFLDELHTIMEFTSTTSGALEYQAINQKLIYKAPLSVKCDNTSIKITQLSDAKSTTSNQTISKDVFECKPDEQRLLEVTANKPDGSVLTFKMRKVE